MATLESYWPGTDPDTYTAIFGTRKSAQSFQLDSDGDVESIIVKCLRVANCGQVKLALQGDSGGDPDGSDIVSKTLAQGDIPEAWGSVTFTFDAAESLSGTTTYWIVCSLPDTPTAGNYFRWGMDTGNPYADGEAKHDFGAGWDADSGSDRHFKVEGVSPYVDISGSATGAGSMSGSLSISANWQTENLKTYRRLVAFANDQVYYESS